MERVLAEGLGLKTDFIFQLINGSLVDKDDYLLVETASEPENMAGNYVVIPSELARIESLDTVKDILTQEFDQSRLLKYYNFCWEGEINCREFVDSYIAQGFDFVEVDVLAIDQSKYNNSYAAEANLRNHKLSFCRVGGRQGMVTWDDWLSFHFAELDQDLPKDIYKRWLETHAELYKRLEDKEQGYMYVATINNEIVATAGLYLDEAANLSRLQMIRTAKSHQSKGIAKKLFAYVFENHLASTDSIVIQADHNDKAVSFYQKLGFSRIEKLCCLSKIK